MPVRLPEHLARKADNFPESSYGATTVILILSGGRRVRDRILGGDYIVKIGGRDITDAAQLDFALSDIRDVVSDPGSWDRVTAPFRMVSRVTAIFCAACAVLSVAAAVLLFSLRDTRGAAAAVLVGLGAALMFLGRSATSIVLPAHSWLSLALIGAGLVIMGFPTAVVAGGIAALLVVQLAANVAVVHRAAKLTLVPVAGGVVPGAEHIVQQFSAEGFRTIGAHRPTSQPIIVTVMIGPASDQLALVTDKVWEVISWFGSRSLVTINSAIAPAPSQILRQEIAGGAPSDILRAHRTALTLLERQDLRPDRFTTEAAALDTAVGLERQVLDVMASSVLTTAARMEMRSGYQTRPLGEDAASRHRISAWLAE